MGQIYHELERYAPGHTIQQLARIYNSTERGVKITLTLRKLRARDYVPNQDRCSEYKK